MDGQLLESFVSAMVSDSKSDLFKCNLLVCLQENSSSFLQNDTKNMERVCALLSRMLDATSSSAGCTLQCHAVVCLTHLLAHLSVAQRQQRLFQSFSELLLTIASDGLRDPTLRAVCCDCLRDLELLYPGLFSQITGSLLVLTQTESSHAASSYVALFLTCLQHAIAVARLSKFARVSFPTKKSSSALVFLLPRPMVPFTVPSLADVAGNDETSSSSSSSSSDQQQQLFSPLLMASLDSGGQDCPIPDYVISEARKAIASLASVAPLILCSSQLASFVWSLLHLQSMVTVDAVPPDLFRSNFFRLLDSGNPLLLHVMLKVRQRHPELFAKTELANDEHLLRRLLACGNDNVTLRVEMRCLSVNLMREFGVWCHVQDSVNPLAPLWKDLWPVVFDDWLVVAAKLFCLVYCFSADNPSPPFFMSALSSLSEFRQHGSSHVLARMTFAVLKLILARLPEQFDHVYRFLLDLLVYAPQFLPNLIDTLSEHLPACNELLNRFSQLLCRLEPIKLRDYIPLAERICEVSTIDATLLLERVAAYISLPDQSEPFSCGSPDEVWALGDTLLNLFRSALIYQASCRLTCWETACSGLFILSQRFPDVEIRDRAHFLYYLASHASADQVVHVLKGVESTTEEELAAGSPMSDSNAESSAETFRVPVSFLKVVRAASNNVNDQGKSKWSDEDLSQNDMVTVEELDKFLHSNLRSSEQDHVRTVKMRLGFMSGEEFDKQKMKKKKSAVVVPKKSPRFRSNDEPEEDELANFQPPNCVVGASLSFVESEMFSTTTQVDVPILRPGEWIDFDLSVAASVPVPVLLQARVDFSFVPPHQEEDFVLCASCTIPKVKWLLEDMFCHWGSDVSLPLLRRMWHHMWASKEMGSECTKRVVVSSAVVEQCIRKHLMRHVVFWNQNVVRVLILMRPSSHLLMEVKMTTTQGSVFHVKCDHFPVLAYVDDMISRFCSTTQ